MHVDTTLIVLVTIAISFLLYKTQHKTFLPKFPQLLKDMAISYDILVTALSRFWYKQPIWEMCCTKHLEITIYLNSYYYHFIIHMLWIFYFITFSFNVYYIRLYLHQRHVKGYVIISGPMDGCGSDYGGRDDDVLVIIITLIITIIIWKKATIWLVIVATLVAMP